MNLDCFYEKTHSLPTPCYVYDLDLLKRTIKAAMDARPDDRYRIHYAIKANPNPEILWYMAKAGMGADCVSKGEVEIALEAEFPPEKIVFAGVAKGDDEIEYALDKNIGCLNVESHEELEVIARIAASKGVKARVALRVNPDIDAHTHHYITTGLAEDKFGIDRRLIDRSIMFAHNHPNIELIGMHFHIGSQIEIMEPFVLLCERINNFIDEYSRKGVEFKTIDVGGGLGIDYDDPDGHPIAPFKEYFDVFAKHLKLRPGQIMLCEPGRSLVAQCGTLLSRVRFVKEGVTKKFVMVDAGMNDLIRPALYQAKHLIQNISAVHDGRADDGKPVEVYDVVGPICESADCFGEEVKLPVTRRGDLIAIRSAGAYGQSMSSTYNSHPLSPAFFLVFSC